MFFFFDMTIMPYRRRSFGKRKRTYRRRYVKRRKYTRRGRAARTIQRNVRQLFRRRKARRIVRNIGKRRANRRLNRALTSSKVQTYARTLPESMMFPESYYTQISGADGVIGVNSLLGTFQCCLQSGIGFYDGTVANALASPINTKFIQDAGTHRQVELLSVKYTFIPWNGQFSADQAGENDDLPTAPCAPQKLYKGGDSPWHGLMLFYHLDGT